MKHCDIILITIGTVAVFVSGRSTPNPTNSCPYNQGINQSPLLRYLEQSTALDITGDPFVPPVPKPG
jgi:hypothetical protein